MHLVIPMKNHTTIFLSHILFSPITFLLLFQNITITHQKTNKLGSNILVTKLPLLKICTTTKLTHNNFILSTKTHNSYFATFKQFPKGTSFIFVDDDNFCVHWMHLTPTPLSHLQKQFTSFPFCTKSLQQFRRE